MQSGGKADGERVWTVVAFCFYSLTIWRNIVLQTYREGLRYLVRKVSFLTWETTILTHVYLSLKLFSPHSPPPSTRHKLFLVCLSLNVIVVVAYWSLYCVNPKLVDPYDYQAWWDVEWATTLFSHGGNLSCLIIEASFLKRDFHSPSFSWFFRVEVAYTVAYCTLQKVCRWYTDEAVYGFLDAMSLVGVCGFYLALSVVSITVKTIATAVLSPKAKTE